MLSNNTKLAGDLELPRSNNDFRLLHRAFVFIFNKSIASFLMETANMLYHVTTYFALVYPTIKPLLFTVPVLCVDEAYSLLHTLTTQGKSNSQTSLSMERLCKCYDGDFWYVLKGTKGKRMGASSAKLALLAFTTPQQFLESVWPRIVGSKNGLSERILLFYQQRSEHLDLEVMAEHSNSLEEFPVKSMGCIFEKIYLEHNTKPPVKYTLNSSAKELFFKYSKPNEDSQEASTSGSVNVVSTGSKKFKNTLRVALNMHILYHRLGKALALETGTTPTVVNAVTMQMAIAFIETLETIKGISGTGEFYSHHYN